MGPQSRQLLHLSSGPPLHLPGRAVLGVGAGAEAGAWALAGHPRAESCQRGRMRRITPSPPGSQVPTTASPGASPSSRGSFCQAALDHNEGWWLERGGRVSTVSFLHPGPFFPPLSSLPRRHVLPSSNGALWAFPCRPPGCLTVPHLYPGTRPRNSTLRPLRHIPRPLPLVLLT